MALLCVTILILDGIDTASIAFVAPALSAAWGLPTAALTPLFLATSVGAVTGYLICGRLVLRWGARRVIICSVAGFGLLTLASMLAGSVMSLTVLRFVTAVGLGTTVPASLALTADHVPAEQRTRVTILVSTGLSLGAAVGAAIGTPVIASFGWQSVFFLGGLVPLLVTPLLIRLLPESRATHAAAAEHVAPAVGHVLDRDRRALTVSLWCFSFLVFMTMYVFLYWLPTLLTLQGFPLRQAPLVSAAFGMGGVIGNIAILPLLARFPLQRILIAAALLTIASLALFSPASGDKPSSLALIVGLGATIAVGCVGQAALAVLLYPPSLRTGGIGYSAASGRLGSIVGPAIAGGLLSLDWEPQALILAAVLPASAACLALVILDRVIHPRATSRSGSEAPALGTTRPAGVVSRGHSTE